MSQGHRPDQIASSERHFALALLLFLAGVIVGTLIEVLR